MVRFNFLGQDETEGRFSFQIDLGVSNTFHYNEPVILSNCIEGCYPEKKEFRTTPNISFNFYRDFNEINSIKMEFGLASYRYWEKGLADNGGGTFYDYEQIKNWGFYTLSVGFRHVLNPSKKVKVFVENEFIYEIPITKTRLLAPGVAIKPMIGTSVSIKNKWSLIAEGFFKSSLTPYSEREYSVNYRPYGYGIQLGIQRRI